MRIAQIAPLFESVPPKSYGGTERVIATLTQELSWMGHEVTIFATADSVVDAELVPCLNEPLTAGKADSPETAVHALEFGEAKRRAAQFDVLHFHTRFSHFPFFEELASKTVTTCHNRIDWPHLDRFYDHYRAFPLISISNAQRAMQPHANWADTIYHGYPLDQYDFTGRQKTDQGYLAFLGRICPEKGVAEAIRIARAAGRPLKFAARINDADQSYYEACIEPLIDDDLIEFVGEVQEHEKCAFLSGAAALLFPIQWPEPFGLVMIEAMACGTPVIGFHNGSVPEVIDEGVTGFVVKSVDAAVEAIDKLEQLHQKKIRQHFEKRFSSRRMAESHVSLYERISAKSSRLQDCIGAPDDLRFKHRNGRHAALSGMVDQKPSDWLAAKDLS